MAFHFVPMEKRYADQIVKWHYPSPFSFYDMEKDPEDLAEFINPKMWPQRYFVGLDEKGTIWGYFSFDFDVTTDILEIGLGLSPDKTGKGFGTSFIQAGLQFAKGVFPYAYVRLSVWKENTRAIRCYEKLGFVKIAECDQNTNGVTFPFITMELR